MKRRGFLKQIGAPGLAIAATRYLVHAAAAKMDEQEIPGITIGRLKVSRVFLGSNP